MCGIAGTVSFFEDVRERREDLINMRSTLGRRGPDATGLYIGQNVGLAHARLAVVDIEGGAQPMKLAHGGEEYVIIYNGELYNTPELRSELVGLGHEFVTHSDTEVLLHAYAEWGDKCADRFNGICAFAVWEERRERLFICRDRSGVKPFFYAEQNGAFIFGSEIKTLLAHPYVKPRVDRAGLRQILLLGPGREPGSGVFKNISELKPGYCGYFGRDGLNLRRYWGLTDREHTDTLPQTVEKVRYLVTDAIERQLVSDVPICTLLSGGLDSSIISAVAAKRAAAESFGVSALDTYSVGYKDNEKYFAASHFQPNSDEHFIDVMNAYLHARPHIVKLETAPLAAALDEATSARDLPGMADVDSSLLLFCREIKKGATVALSGECSDELFGGYPWYRDKDIRERDGFPWSQSTAYRASFISDGVISSREAMEYMDSLYKSAVAAADVSATDDPLERRMRVMTSLNFNWFMQTLLDRKDRMSMYSGLEVRVPFCDWRIAEYLYAVPWEMKDLRGYEKGLLREAMRGLLPDEVLWRKKSPYPKTHNPAYLAAVSELLRAVIADKNAPILSIIKRGALLELLESNNPTPWYGQLMTTPQTIAYMLQIDAWLRKYNVEVEL